MNVRLHSFGQKWQTVSSSFFDVYSRSIARIDADEGRRALALDDAQGLHRRADRAGLARVRVHEHLRARGRAP